MSSDEEIYKRALATVHNVCNFAAPSSPSLSNTPSICAPCSSTLVATIPGALVIPAPAVSTDIRQKINGNLSDEDAEMLAQIESAEALFKLNRNQEARKLSDMIIAGYDKSLAKGFAALIGAADSPIVPRVEPSPIIPAPPISHDSEENEIPLNITRRRERPEQPKIVPPDPKIAELEAQIAAFQSDQESLYQEMLEEKRSREKLDAENKIHLAKIEMLERKIREHKTAEKKQTEEIAVLQAKNDDLEEENSKANYALSEIKADLEHAIVAKKTAEAGANELKITFEKLAESFRKYQLENQKLKEEIATYRERLAAGSSGSSSTAINAIKAEVDELRSALHRAERVQTRINNSPSTSGYDTPPRSVVQVVPAPVVQQWPEINWQTATNVIIISIVALWFLSSLFFRNTSA
jgi:DNA repair exonuclease SbcCD ATPase subunit